MWYAPSDNVEFKFLVKMTGLCNCFLFASLFFFLGSVIFRLGELF